VPISREEEARRFQQIQRLNIFYVLTVIVMTVTLLLLLFNINAEQRRLIDETATLIEQRVEEADYNDHQAELRLERALDRLEEVEALIEARLEPDRIENLEESIVKRIEELLNELEQQ